MERELASTTTTRILPAWTPAVFTMLQAPGFEDWDAVWIDAVELQIQLTFAVGLPAPSS